MITSPLPIHLHIQSNKIMLTLAKSTFFTMTFRQSNQQHMFQLLFFLMIQSVGKTEEKSREKTCENDEADSLSHFDEDKENVVVI